MSLLLHAACCAVTISLTWCWCLPNTMTGYAEALYKKGSCKYILLGVPGSVLGSKSYAIRPELAGWPRR